jgi:hypothetical protein
MCHYEGTAWCHLEGTHRVSPQIPLTLPLTLPPSLRARLARVGQEREEKRGEPATSKLSLSAECYRLARQKEGESGAALVAKALQNFASPEDVLAVVRDAIELGDDLGHALWELSEKGT